MKRNDQKLISDYLEGDEKALTVLVDRYLADAYSFALKLTNDGQVAEDITQESFTKAWKSIRQFISTNSFRGWLFTIVRNTAIDFLRRKREVPFSLFETNTKGENTLISTLADTSPLPDELLARAEDERYLGFLLEQINPEYKEVFMLRYTSNMTFAEIGKSLKRPLHTVKSQYRRGIVSLRRLLDTQSA